MMLYYLTDKLWSLLVCTVGPQVVGSTLEGLAEAAIATVSVTSNQTQSLFICLTNKISAYY